MPTRKKTNSGLVQNVNINYLIKFYAYTTTLIDCAFSVSGLRGSDLSGCPVRIPRIYPLRGPLPHKCGPRLCAKFKLRKLKNFFQEKFMVSGIKYIVKNGNSFCGIEIMARRYTLMYILVSVLWYAV